VTLTPARAVLEPPGDEPALLGFGVDVSAGHVRVLTRGRQETPGSDQEK